MRPGLGLRIDADAVVLEHWRSEDAAALLAAVSESLDHLRPWMAWAAAPPTLVAMDGFIVRSNEGFDTGTDFNYAIREPRRPAVLGGCGLHRRHGPGVLEIGYWVHAAHTRRGLATAAAGALARTALAIPDVARVEIHCDVTNVPSAGVARRLGFRLDRVEDDAVRAPAETGRAMIWVLERDQPPAAG
jgi:RimJ/RimL family protein N-acetyltransferase